VTLHVQANGILGTTLPNPFPWNFNTPKEVWIVISNGSQVPVTITIQGGKNLYPTETILQGQPFAKKFDCKIVSIAGAGADVNIKIQDDPPEEGQIQEISQERQPLPATVISAGGASPIVTVIGPGVGQVWHLTAVKVKVTDNTGGATSYGGEIDLLVTGDSTGPLILLLMAAASQTVANGNPATFGVAVAPSGASWGQTGTSTGVLVILPAILDISNPDTLRITVNWVGVASVGITIELSGWVENL